MTVINPGGGGTALTQGTLAGRAAPSVAGSLYYATDVGQMFVTNAAGNAWQTVGAMLFGTAGARPAAGAGNANTVYFATDSNEVTFSDGAAWHNVKQIWGGSFAIGAGLGLGVGAWTIDSNTNLNSTQGGAFVDSKGGFRGGEAANAKQGTIGAMTAGAVTVANTSVTANSRIFPMRGPGGTNPGAWSVSAITAATSFAVVSTNAADTGTGWYEIFEPG